MLLSPLCPASVIWELLVSDGIATRGESLTTWHCGTSLRPGALSVALLMLIFPTNPTIRSRSWIIFGGDSWVRPRAGPQMLHSLLPHSSLSTNNEVLQLKNDITIACSSLDLETQLCLKARGLGSVILLGTWTERKFRYEWAQKVSLSTVLASPS